MAKTDNEKKEAFCSKRCKANKNGIFCCMTYGKPNPLRCEWIFIRNGRVRQYDMPEDL